ncbi:macro domain-containing protein [Candidatus Halobeggiatoa sp. HSG11]|nr:macro domain-containing protein [Candidatus Halobeggiatoa sp. HSG11]
MKEIKGDIIKLAIEGKLDVIVHGCNCFCNMGAGIAKSIKAAFPEAYQADLKTVKGSRTKLGTIGYAEIKKANHKIIIVNAYTQYNYKGRGRQVDYDAMKSCFKEIKEKFSGLKICFPKIGAGLAGGDWETISKIIESELAGEDCTLVTYKPLNNNKMFNWIRW